MADNINLTSSADFSAFDDIEQRVSRLKTTLEGLAQSLEAALGSDDPLAGLARSLSNQIAPLSELRREAKELNQQIIDLRNQRRDLARSETAGGLTVEQGAETREAIAQKEREIADAELERSTAVSLLEEGYNRLKLRMEEQLDTAQITKRVLESTDAEVIGTNSITAAETLKGLIQETQTAIANVRDRLAESGLRAEELTRAQQRGQAKVQALLLQELRIRDELNREQRKLAEKDILLRKGRAETDPSLNIRERGIFEDAEIAAQRIPLVEQKLAALRAEIEQTQAASRRLNEQLTQFEIGQGAEQTLEQLIKRLRTLVAIGEQPPEDPTEEWGSLENRKDELEEILNVLERFKTGEETDFEVLSQELTELTAILPSLGQQAEGVLETLRSGQEIDIIDTDRQFQEIRKLDKAMFSVLRGFARRVAATFQFSLIGGALLKAREIVKEFFDSVVQVERTFADIESALSFDISSTSGVKNFNTELDKVRFGVQDLSNELNVLPTVANEVAFQMVALFGNVEDALTATRGALLAIKVSTINVAETVNATTAIATTFSESLANIGNEEQIAARRAELFNEAVDNAIVIQQKYNRTAEETLKGTAAAGSLFKSLGFDLAETQAIIGITSRRFGGSAIQIAERLNRAFGQFDTAQVRADLVALAQANDAFVLSATDFDVPAVALERIAQQTERLSVEAPNVLRQIEQIIGTRREAPFVGAFLRSFEEIEASVIDMAVNTDAAFARLNVLFPTLSETLASISTHFQNIAANLALIGALSPIRFLLIGFNTLLGTLDSILQLFTKFIRLLDRIPVPGFSGFGNLLVTMISLNATFRTTYLLLNSIKRVAATNLGLAVTQGLAGGLQGLLAAAGLGTGLARGASAAGAGRFVGLSAAAPEKLAKAQLLLKNAMGQAGKAAATLAQGVIGLGTRGFPTLTKAFVAAQLAISAHTAALARNTIAARASAVAEGLRGAFTFLRTKGLAGLLAKFKELIPFAVRAIAFLGRFAVTVGGLTTLIIGATAGLQAFAGVLGLVAEKVGLAGDDPRGVEAAQRRATEQFDEQVAAGLTPDFGEILRKELEQVNKELEAKSERLFSTIGGTIQDVFLTSLTAIPFVDAEDMNGRTTDDLALQRLEVQAELAGLLISENQQKIMDILGVQNEALLGVEDFGSAMTALRQVVESNPAAFSGLDSSVLRGPDSGPTTAIEFFFALNAVQEEIAKAVESGQNPSRTRKSIKAIQELIDSLEGDQGLFTVIGQLFEATFGTGEIGFKENIIQNMEDAQRDIDLGFGTFDGIRQALQEGLAGFDVRAARPGADIAGIAEERKEVVLFFIGLLENEVNRLAANFDPNAEGAAGQQAKIQSLRFKLRDLQALADTGDVGSLLIDEVLRDLGYAQAAAINVAEEGATALEARLQELQGRLGVTTGTVEQERLLLLIAELAGKQAQEVLEALTGGPGASDYEKILARQDPEFITANIAAKLAELRVQEFYEDQRKRLASLQVLENNSLAVQATTLRANTEAIREAIAIAREREDIFAEREGLIALQTALLQEEEEELRRRSSFFQLEAGVYDSLKQAQAQALAATERLALLREQNAQDSREFYEAELALMRANKSIADLVQEEEDLVRSLASDFTDPVVDAINNIISLTQQLQNEALGDLERLKLQDQLRRAEQNLMTESFNQVLSDLDFAFQMGEIGLSGYINQLRALAGSVDTSTREGLELWQSIQLKIKNLVEGTNNALQFNIPTEIRLPTLFEVRRALAADSLGVNYQDNRQQDIRVEVNSVVELEELLAVLDGRYGAGNVNVIAPGAAGLTAGAF